MRASTNPTSKRVLVFVALALGALGLGVALCLHLASQKALSRVQAALGPDATVGTIRVGLNRIEIDDVRIARPSGWPAAELFSAQHATIDLSFLSLLSSEPLHVTKIRLQGALLTSLRQRDGHVQILPPIPALNPPPRSNPTTPIANAIDSLEMDGRVEIYDASVRTPPLKLVLDPVHVELDGIAIPLGDSKMTLDAKGVVPGPQSVADDGTVELKGWITRGKGDSEITTQVRHVALVLLQPYLLRATESGVRGGTLDLDLDARVTAGHLHAPGTLTLNHLELAPAGHGLETFMGLSREVVLKGMENGHGSIETHFTLEGNLSDPQFLLNEDLAMRAGAGLAEALGVSVSTIAKTVGSAGQSGADLAGKIVEGAQGVVKGLFSK
ncbi:MAG: DUF748 domain-containing protein [Burkholderiaceae bacterium]|jgi:hypothetical protein